MTVADLMTPRPNTVAPWDTRAAAQKKMHAGDFRALPVVQVGRVVGVLSDRDVLPFAAHSGEIPVKEAMTRAVITVNPGTPLQAAARLMLRHKIGGLPVVQEEQLVDVITPSDIIAAFVRLMGEENRSN